MSDQLKVPRQPTTILDDLEAEAARLTSTGDPLARTLSVLLGVVAAQRQSAAEIAQAVSVAARGLSSEAERDLVRRVIETVRREHSRVGQAITWRNVIVGALIIVAAFACGAGAGWWWHGDPHPVTCSEQTGGGVACGYWLVPAPTKPAKPN